MLKAFFRSGQERGGDEPARLPPGMRIYAVGDIHGCVGLLDRLHGLIETDLAAGRPEQVQLVYLGDYVNRGADSKGVLDRLSAPTPQGLTRVFLKGNHEDMFLGFLKDSDQGETWCRVGGFETLLSYRIDPRAVLAEGGYPQLAEALAAAMPPAHTAFLADLRPSFSVGAYFFCHAGVRPGVPLAKQTPFDLRWIRREFLDSDADHGKIIIHGHSPAELPEVRPNRINVDTGAYATGRLTALVLEGSEHRFLHT